MSDDLCGQRDYAVRQLAILIDRGNQLAATLHSPTDGDASRHAVDSWQDACAAAIHQLSGGSKAHWLSRAYSEALLVRSREGGVVVEATVAEIVDRVLAVLHQASASLARLDDVATASLTDTPAARRFDFVRNEDLRPVLEKALVESRRAFDGGDYRTALIVASGILEAVITDALERAGHADVTSWSFDERIATAERTGLIRRGCARLPPVARLHRDRLAEDHPVVAREARAAAQVLRVVMRDLDPGR